MPSPKKLRRQGDVDDAFVHHAFLGLPGHCFQEPGEEVVGSRDPAVADVEPRAVGQRGAFDGGAEGAEPRVGGGVEEGAL